MKRLELRLGSSNPILSRYPLHQLHIQTNINWYYQMVTHLDTAQARLCLNSGYGRKQRNIEDDDKYDEEVEEEKGKFDFTL